MKFDGTMSIAERNKVLHAFRNSPSFCILLMSLKCGGVGMKKQRNQKKKVKNFRSQFGRSKSCYFNGYLVESSSRSLVDVEKIKIIF
jgi:hypothetical protein